MGGLFSMFFSPSNKYDVAKIKLGFTKNQVRAVFGVPDDVVQVGGTEEWIYTVPFRIFATIYFDSDGTVYRTYRSGESVF